MIFPGFSTNLSLTVELLLKEMLYVNTEPVQSTRSCCHLASSRQVELQAEFALHHMENVFTVIENRAAS